MGPLGYPLCFVCKFVGCGDPKLTGGAYGQDVFRETFGPGPRRVTAMRTTSSGIHIRSDDDEKKFFPHLEAFVRVWGTAAKAELFIFDILSSLQA